MTTAPATHSFANDNHCLHRTVLSRQVPRRSSGPPAPSDPTGHRAGTRSWPVMCHIQEGEKRNR